MKQIIEDIAKTYLNINTLKTRNSEQLDFYDLPVWRIRDALEAAYIAGKLAAEGE